MKTKTNHELITIISQNSFSQITLSKVFNTIKNNLSILVIIPGIFGGLWQIIELFSISPSLVRFFSISQILPDGLIILGLILMAILFAFYASTLLIVLANIIPARFLIVPNEEIKEVIFEQSWLRSIIHLFFFFICFGLSFFIFKNVILENYLYLVGYLIYIMLIGFLSIVFIQQSFLFAPSKFKPFLRVVTLLIPIIFFFLISTFCREFKKTIKFPNNFTNISRLMINLRLNNPGADIKLLYMNDKYIFVEKTSKKNQKKDFDIEIINNSQLTEK